ncbi:phage minor capsid protein [Streptomyces sp. NPDC058674]|uniref:phage minor capsid protein n=1 Tax=Streptomyces sp. NPDC058674 TaxID=3346592 RepID=UPI0036659910
MPVSPAMAEDLAAAVSMLYEDAEYALISILRDALMSGIDSPRWAELKLRAVGDLREAVETVADALQQDANGAVAEALMTAYGRGRQAAVAELGALDTGRELHVRRILPGAPAVDRLAASFAADTRPLYQRITRAILDVFRNITTRAAGTQLLTGMTRRDASQRALDEFARRGIVGFVDSRGHGWNLATYAEMAARSVTARAAIDGHIDAMAEVGQGLVIVSDAPLECELCEPWEGEVLALAGGPGPHTVRVEHAVQPTGLRAAFRPPTTVAVHVAGSLPEARSKGLFHPNCFPGDVLVTAPSGVRAADSRWYEGDLVVIHTASGNELSVTPNHPVLTPEGWVAAGEIQVGGRVLRYGEGVERVDGVGPGYEKVPARIGDVFDALRQAFPVGSVHVPGAAEQFHGDGFDADVEVVLAEGLLADGREPAGAEQLGYGQLLAGGAGAGALLADGSSFEVLASAGHAANGVMCPRHLGGSGLGAHGGPLAGLGFTTADSGTAFADPATDGSLADAEGGRQLALALTSSVSSDQVVNVGRREFAGHVYNLQTGDGWYVAGGLVVHNCRHSLGLYLPGVTTKPPHHPTPGTTYADTQRQRAIERHIREWKRRQAAAMDESARLKAAAKVRHWQAEARAHVAAHEHIVRKPAREQIGRAH